MGKDVLILDFETAGLLDLKSCGVTKYINDACEVRSVAYSFHGADPTTSIVNPSLDQVKDLIDSATTVVVFNLCFEHKVLLKLYGIDCLNILLDISVLTTVLGLGRSLDTAAKTLGLHKSKLKIDKRLFSISYIPSADELQVLSDYNIRDVDVTKELYAHLAEYKEPNQHLFDEYIEDIYFNSKGIKVDVERLNAMMDQFKSHYEKLSLQIEKLSTKLFGIHITFNHRKRLADKLKPLYDSVVGTNRVDIETFSYENLQLMLDSLDGITSDAGKDLRTYLALLIETSSSSLKKLQKIKDYLVEDRIYDYLRFCGTHTQRWVGSGVQIQNLPRSNTDDLKGNIRSLLIPTADYFMKVDFKQIESRVIAWFTGDPNLIKIYNSGEDIYSTFGNLIKSHIGTEGLDYRRLGKIAILGCGYGMGKTAFSKLHKLPLPLCELLITLYRQTFSQVPKFWKYLELLIVEALHTSKVSKRLKHLTLEINKSFINSMPVIAVTILISTYKYNIYYLDLRDDEGTLTYIQEGKRLKLYGAKIFNHIIQMLARQIMSGLKSQFFKHKEVFLEGLMIPFSLHDELVLDISESDIDLSYSILDRYEESNFISSCPVNPIKLPTDRELLTSYK